MGITVTNENDIDNNLINKVYRCSNCGDIVIQIAQRSGEIHHIDWQSMYPKCGCGEELIIPITVYSPKIDKVISIEL